MLEPARPHDQSRDLWSAVDRLVDRTPSVGDLASHRIELLAARRWRMLGLPVPPEIVEHERRATVVALAAPLLLERVRAAYDGDIMLLKGLEVARHYPHPALRTFGDIDLLIDDSAAAQAALLTAGFEEVGDPALYREIHHLRPLRWPDLPLVVEIHSRPKWIEGVSAPSTDELFSVAVSGEGGVKVLPAAQHTLLLVAHSWAHEPLRRLRDLIDIAVLAQVAGRADVDVLARQWRIERLWRVTIAAADAVLEGEHRPWPLRLWARNLERVSERTVLENHLQRWFSDFSIMSFRTAAARVPATFGDELRREEGEGWGDKLSRSMRAVRNASRRKSEHDEELAREHRRN